MGLDMYLERVKKEAGTFEDVLRIEGELNSVDYEKYEKKYEKLLFEKGRHIKWKSLFGEVAYWRKANHIHKWFVDNVQNGKDDGGTYLVTKENIQKLKSVLDEVINSCELIPGQIHESDQLINGEWVKKYVDGLIIKNTGKAKELLPTQSGFFFGNTDYDERYYRDLVYTSHICEAILNFFEFDNYYLTYSASW